MLALICFLLAVGACVINLFFEGTIRLEWILGFTALGLAFGAAGLGPAVTWRPGRSE